MGETGLENIVPLYRKGVKTSGLHGMLGGVRLMRCEMKSSRNVCSNVCIHVGMNGLLLCQRLHEFRCAWIPPNWCIESH